MMCSGGAFMFTIKGILSMTHPTFHPHRITLGLFGSSETDTAALSAIFTLAGSSLKASWRLTTEEPADITMVVIDSPSDTTWQSALTRCPVERLIAYAGQNDTPEAARWKLLRRGAGRPPSLKELSQVLNEISACWEELSVLLPEKDESDGSRHKYYGDESVFVPETRLLGLIQSIAEGKKNCRIALPKGPEIYIFSEESVFFSQATIEGLLPLCVTECQFLEVDAIQQPSMMSELVEQGYRKSTLIELIWFAALVGSQGRLLSECRLEEPVHLRQWPDFARLPYYSEYQSLASRMTKEVATLSDLATSTETPLGQVIDFHNACTALKLIERGTSATAHVEKRSLCRECMSNAFGTLTQDGKWKRIVKVLITGSVGAGKTTSILEASDLVPVLTEARPSDEVGNKKATTTVAMDYGEMALSCGVKVQLLGTPGQRRFEFMGQILCRNVWGLIILIDHSTEDPLDDLAYYLQLYSEFLPKLQLAVAITRHEYDPHVSLDAYRVLLKERGAKGTLDFFDPRQASNLFDLLTRMAKISYLSE